MSLKTGAVLNLSSVGTSSVLVFLCPPQTQRSVKLSLYFQVYVAISDIFNLVSEFWTPLCVLTLEYRNTLCSVVFAFSQNHKYLIDPRGKIGTLQLLLLE